MAEQTWFPDEDQDQDSTDGMIEVRFNGQTIRMTPEAARAWEERERSFSQRFSEQGRELGELRQLARQPAQPVHGPQHSASSATDPDVEFLQNPVQVVSRMLDEREQRAYQQIRMEQEQMRARDEAKRKFFARHRDLIEHQDKVEYIAQKRGHMVANLPAEEADDRLAEMVRREFNLEVPGQHTVPSGTRTQMPTGPARSARSATVQQRPPTREDTEWKGPNTTAEIQKALYAKREQARKRQGGGRPPATG